MLKSLVLRALPDPGAGLALRRPGQRAVDYFYMTEPHVARLRRADVRIA